jgi:hypothetical protein
MVAIVLANRKILKVRPIIALKKVGEWGGVKYASR